MRGRLPSRLARPGRWVPIRVLRVPQATGDGVTTSLASPLPLPHPLGSRRSLPNSTRLSQHPRSKLMHPPWSSALGSGGCAARTFGEAGVCVRGWGGSRLRESSWSLSLLGGGRPPPPGGMEPASQPIHKEQTRGRTVRARGARGESQVGGTRLRAVRPLGSGCSAHSGPREERAGERPRSPPRTPPLQSRARSCRPLSGPRRAGTF